MKGYNDMVNNIISKDMIDFEELNVKEDGDHEIISLPVLPEEKIKMINPLIPPTSGIRLKLLEQKEKRYFCSAENYSMFLRLFNAIGALMTERSGNGANILITSDERPTSDKLVSHAIQILVSAGHTIYIQHQEEEKVPMVEFNHSGVSTPYSSACLALFHNIDAVLTVTASHNSALWNGVKFYFKNPIPIAGDTMRSISQKAINTDKVTLKPRSEITLNGKDYEAKVNEYVKELISHIIPIEAVQGKKIILWPYMGNARGINDLLKGLGIEVILIEQTMEPPDPTVNLSIDDVEKLLEENDSPLAILLDADRDRIVFIVKTRDGFIKMNPNELYTSMHNILISKFDKKVINVRTVPSDPRCDNLSICTIESGVGYKHLGIIQFVACGMDIDQSQFNSALVYGDESNGKIRLDNRDKIKDFLQKHLENTSGNILMVLWEESGGHTINIVTPGQNSEGFSLKSTLPLIGDKFPAPAIVILSELLAREYDLQDAIDSSISGKRITIKANDERKQEIMNRLEGLVGKTISIDEKTYQVGDYRDNQGNLDIISFKEKNSSLFVRPSGTGNSVRVYVFGEKRTIEKEIKKVAEYIENL